MKRLNWKIILGNVREAREELQALEAAIESGRQRSEEDLEISLRHASHHLNFAWNIRRVTTKGYANLSNAEFRRWGRYPTMFADD